ncbi:MAG: DUF4387 domain-containing protein [Lachnospiraceae bacterium]|nr:DUF4387 domain-containing protein [Lachnospiraceae bacterium]
MKTLYDIAKVIRSKNAGPFSITLDVLFDSEEIYQRVKERDLINREVIARLYQIPESSITELVYFDQAHGIKVTYDRPISSGTVGDRDVYGAQQHAPMMLLPVDDSIWQ